MAPRAIAEALAAKLAADPRITKAEVAGPGFLNLRLSPLVWQGVVKAALVEGGIRLVKAGRVDQGRQALEQALEMLAAQDCRHAILGCTEVSVAFGTERQRHGIQLFDSNMALARALLRHIGRVPKN